MNSAVKWTIFEVTSLTQWSKVKQRGNRIAQKQRKEDPHCFNNEVKTIIESLLI